MVAQPRWGRVASPTTPASSPTRLRRLVAPLSSSSRSGIAFNACVEGTAATSAASWKRCLRRVDAASPADACVAGTGPPLRRPRRLVEALPSSQPRAIVVNVCAVIAAPSPPPPPRRAAFVRPGRHRLQRLRCGHRPPPSPRGNAAFVKPAHHRHRRLRRGHRQGEERRRVGALTSSESGSIGVNAGVVGSDASTNDDAWKRW